MEYLTNRRASFTAHGDFVRYALSDPNFPDAELWDQVQTYLSQATDLRVRLYLVSAEAVWDNYQAKLETLHGR